MSRTDVNPSGPIGFVRNLGWLGVVIAIGLIVLWSAWYTVPEGFRGVILRNNAAIGEAAPGFGLKLPFFDSIVDMSVQTETARFENVISYSKDIQQSDSIVNVNIRLDPNRVLDIYSTVGIGYAEKVVWPAVFRRYKEVFGQHVAAEIVNQRDLIAQEVHALLVADLQPRGLIIEAVQIENINFSDTYEHAVEATAKAEADVKRARQELEQAKVNAQRQVAEAEARAQATRATADAEAYATRARGEAEAAAIAARGKALRDNPDLIALIAAEKWNGVLPTTMLPGATLPFIEVGATPVGPR